MTVPPDRLELAASFPETDRDRWRELALGVLRKAGAEVEGRAVEEVLGSETPDGVPISPLYDADDAGDLAARAGVPGLPPYTRGGRAGGGVLGGWDVRQRHDVPSNAALLTDLENGVTSLWLVLGDGAIPLGSLDDVLRGVRLDLAPVALDPGPYGGAAAEAFLRLRPSAGNLGLSCADDRLGELARRCAADFPGVRAAVIDGLAYHGMGGGDAQELGCALAEGVAALRTLTDAGLDVADAFRAVEFRYAATADQFVTIAKFRAARRLWARVGEVCGVPEAAQVQHAVTSPAMMTRRDPWVNMLRTTLACFGAGVGGADAVTVLPFDLRLGLPDDFARRIARNTQSLLMEESNVARVIDPAGGSWYVERLTDDLAHAAWEWFTEIERAGGLPKASGLVRERLAATWERRREDIAHRRAPITGVSEFPNLEERLPQRRPAAREPEGVHYAQEFEELRDLADAQAVRPRVYLATLGPLAAHTARAGFAGNLFRAGGIETVAGPPEEFASSGCAVACLCSSDRLYAEGAAGAARALKEAGAAKVWLAGRPGDYEGVDDYVYAGCDAVSVIRTTLSDLGAK
ncbi:methylmalonyl-CoA mutase family protein [Bailinhaonella thermotolerans]|uniref:methylmalonyl-CoA mutase n=1 Tax=Bailinhaonella thermotolerans TaxID=1070861 RepID=A0A3A4AQL1_9ACTN|nr:methylmalonyl-CoA mutase family protein [Bailinhaonella thermotolerans]RJL32016.1 methylmalonyl-CoA mutase [Bailinhaonella thermotolerans]